MRHDVGAAPHQHVRLQLAWNRGVDDRVTQSILWRVEAADEVEGVRGGLAAERFVAEKSSGNIEK
jgi:hypothetical protein